MKRITVMLAEDHTIVREAYRRMVEHEHDLRVVGEADDGRQAVEMVKKLHPDVVVMDISMPHLNGLEAARQVSQVAPTTKVLILSAYCEDAYVAKAMECGAAGYLTKETSAHTMLRAVREVHRGRKYFSPCISKIRGRINSPSSNRTRMINKKAAELTSREMEVLQLVAEGNANKQTAAELGIGIKTVEKHRGHLMDKLNIHNTAGLTRYAIGTGVIETSLFGKRGIRNPITLRGPVNSESEKSGTLALARSIAGDGNVDDQLEIKSNP